MLEQRYDDLQPLRKTAVGDVFSAVHRVLGRPVHVCIIASELRPETRASLADRVKRVSRLTHPHVLGIIDADFDADTSYFVTESVRAETLLSLLHGEPIAREHALRIVGQLLDAVHYAHAHDLVHGGLSPARVFFDAVGAVRLGDFGISSARTDARAGTVAIDTDAMPYLPIRVLRNPDAYDAAADLHCAAAIAFHLLTGSAPESGAPTHVAGVSDDVVKALAALMEDNADSETLAAAIDVFETLAAPRAHRAVASGSSDEADLPDNEPAEQTLDPVPDDQGNEDETTEESVAELRASVATASSESDGAEHEVLDDDAEHDVEHDDVEDDDVEEPSDFRSTARGINPGRTTGGTMMMSSPSADYAAVGPGRPPAPSTTAMDAVAGIPVGDGKTLLEPSAALLEQVSALADGTRPTDDVSSLDVTDEDVQSSGPHLATAHDSDGVASYGDATVSDAHPGVATTSPHDDEHAAGLAAEPIAAAPAYHDASAQSEPAAEAVAAAKRAADRVAGKLNKYAHLLGQ